MKILKIDASNPEKEKIEQAAKVIKIGGLVVYPTDTLVGLGANAFDDNAVRRVFEAKMRPIDKSISVAFSSIEHAKKFVMFNKAAEKLAKKFLPGPLTLILPFRTEFQNAFLVGRENLGVRVLNHPVAQALLKAVKTPITATSANVSGGENPATAEEAIGQIGDKVDLVLDAGACKYGKPSTVVDCTDEMKVLREGVIEKEEILKI